MNKPSSHDQAEGLRQQIHDLKQEANEPDAFSLPPRSEVHKKTNRKTKWKIKYPVIRLLALFFILLPISILSIYYLYDKKSTSVIMLNENNSYETVDIADENDEQKTKIKQNSQPIQSTSSEEVKPPADERQAVSETEQTESDEKVITHVVQENETLFSIAMKYYKSDEGMQIIKEWNELDSSQLHKGQVLKIPVFEMSK
ncbi:LysM domain-containing protein [Anoxybacillus vitaminiphilus]|uniref:LysM domain-containing protein n=1 Tax=Paranoxybacillus vitaminiphilus TaxID=581036 RepID=A0A327YPL3_9BACL|nr:LysM peptidoglycan-binding domain-containing protein [Anoxybacillus vitaminiphilus]RAK22197.1 LysM domain-containing protein [Anoxybacillus vitaminiphilus]